MAVARRKPPRPFRRLKSSPEVIRLAVTIRVRYPPLLRNVEDLADISDLQGRSVIDDVAEIVGDGALHILIDCLDHTLL